MINDAVKNIADGMQEASVATEEISASIEEVDASTNASQFKERATEAQINSQKAIEETRKISTEKKNNMEKAIEDGKVVDSIKVMADTIAEVQSVFKSSIDTGSDILEFINEDVHAQFDAYGETGNHYQDDAEFVSKMSEATKAIEKVTLTAQKLNEMVHKFKI